jgi:N-acetylmuramoyl-L-alanine amidase
MNRFFEWLKGIFGDKKKSDTETRVEQSVEGPTNPEIVEKVEVPLDPAVVKKVAIVVGHCQRSPGAVNYRNETEYSFNKRVATYIKAYLENYSGKECGIFLRDGIGRTGVAEKTKAWGADLTLELHFNSFRTVAYGCEVLVLSGAKHFDESVVMADELTDDLNREFKLGERHTFKTDDGEIRDGVKVLNSEDRGSYNLRAMENVGIKYSLLIEPCFANFRTRESEIIFENERKYAEVVAEYLVSL